MSQRFAVIAEASARWVGSPLSFVLHLVLIAGAVAMFPVWGWQATLVVLTSILTVTTELIAVLISNTQMRGEAERKILLRHIAEDLPDVDDQKARAEIEAET